MLEENSLKILKITFITEDGEELEKDQLPDEDYQRFCDEFESSRIYYKVRWPEFDERYVK